MSEQVVTGFMDPAKTAELRAQFPILKEQVNGKPLVYFDNAATSQKPRRVIKSVSAYYATKNSNVHRGVHHLSTIATEEQEAARKKVQGFINAKHNHEIIFTKGSTESLNIAAFSLGELLLKAGDEVLITCMEHHANIVPWQLACDRHGAVLKVIPVDEKGTLLLNQDEGWITDKTKILALTHVSNTLGTINPIKKIIAEAQKHNITTVIDGAQAVPHMQVDVQDINCDLYVFSAHKMYGPTGVGVLYGKEVLLEKMPPYQGGGEMIDVVTFEKTTYAGLPFKFEAGTPNIAGIIGLGTAIDWLDTVGILNVSAQEDALLVKATEAVHTIEGLRIIGASSNKAGVLSFHIDGVHHYDLGTLLDQQGIAVRTGHHCTQPLMQRYGISGTTRASFAVYNTEEEINHFVSALKKAIKMLR